MHRCNDARRAGMRFPTQDRAALRKSEYTDRYMEKMLKLIPDLDTAGSVACSWYANACANVQVHSVQEHTTLPLQLSMSMRHTRPTFSKRYCNHSLVHPFS